MPHREIEFGGLRVREMVERVPMEVALDASDCELDRGGIDGRHGYRRAAEDAVTGSTMALPTTSNKGASIFTDGTDESDTLYYNYACLNGDNLTLWVDERGSLIPRIWQSSLSTKAVGSATATLITPANIGADGEILPADATMPGYGLARTATGQGDAASTEACIETRRELLTCGGGSVASGWSLTSDHVDLGAGGVYYRDTDVTEVTAFTVSGANAGSSPISATSTCKFQDSGLVDLLEVKHIFSFQEAATRLAKTRVKVRVELRNMTGTPITGLRYAHVIDPNPATTTGTTTQGIGAGQPTPDETAFAIYGISGSNFVGLGVYNDGDNVQGVALATTPADVEAAILSDPLAQVAASLNILLGTGTNADYRSGTSVVDSTTDFQTDTAWQSNALAASGDRALLVLTDEITIAGGATEVFEFYFFTALAEDEGEGEPQLLLRYRPGTESVTDARTVPVIGGSVWEIEDPSSETLIDGVATLVGSPFEPTARISGAQLGKYLILASDVQDDPWQRMKPDYTLEALSLIPKGATPTAALSTLTVQKFTDGAVFGADTNIGGSANSTVATDYVEVTGADGAGIQYPYDNDQDWSSMNWAMIVVSPPTESDGGGTVTISVATNAGNFEKIGDIYDTPGGKSPGVVFCPLVGLSSATRAAVRRVQFVRNGGTGAFLVHGVMPIPSAPQAGSVEYFVTFQDAATEAESIPTERVTVNFDSSAVTIPTFHLVRRHYATYADEGLASANPETMDPAVMFNKSSPNPYPALTEFAGVPTFSGTAPAGTFDTVRLWRIADNGTRLVKSKAATPSNPYTITDDSGAFGASKALYKAVGTPPPCMAMAAVGGRIAAGGDPANPNRLNISSFLPFAQEIDPFPQFPPYPVSEADGHAYDVGDSGAEQILWLGEGDKALYIGTNYAMYVVTDLSPFPPIGTGVKPFTIWKAGIIGRRGAVWAEDRLWWASHDGIYTARSRADVEDLTLNNKTIYREWLLPDSSTNVEYQDRKLIVTRGTRFMRLDLVTGRWTRGTRAHTFLHSDHWRDPEGTIQHLWYLDSEGYVARWQPGTGPDDTNRATTDAGEDIPAWVYETGYDVTPVSARIKMVYLETDGEIRVTAFRNAAVSRTKIFPNAGEHELALAADLRGYKTKLKFEAENLVSLKRAMFERSEVKGAKGGGTKE